jgi:hypothetical protein
MISNGTHSASSHAQGFVLRQLAAAADQVRCHDLSNPQLAAGSIYCFRTIEYSDDPHPRSARALSHLEDAGLITRVSSRKARIIQLVKVS